MLVSTNRTVVQFVPADPVSRAELANLSLDLVLQPLKPDELGRMPRELLQVRDDQGAD